MCLAVTCHLHFWQNDRDRVRATAVTRGWNGYRNLESAQKVDPGVNENVRSGNRTPARNLRSRVRRSATELFRVAISDNQLGDGRMLCLRFCLLQCM